MHLDSRLSIIRQTYTRKIYTVNPNLKERTILMLPHPPQGTGAACVYPLLGAAHFGWCMLATETDTMSHKSALENVEKNGLSKQIAIMKVREGLMC